MRYAQTLSVYIIYSNEAVYYPSYAGIIRIRSAGLELRFARLSRELPSPPIFRIPLYTHACALSSHCASERVYVSAMRASISCISCRADGGERISTFVPKPKSHA